MTHSCLYFSWKYQFRFNYALVKLLGDVIQTKLAANGKSLLILGNSFSVVLLFSHFQWFLGLVPGFKFRDQNRWGSGNHMGCLGWNLSCHCARQVPYPLNYLPAPPARKVPHLMYLSLCSYENARKKKCLLR